MIVILHFLRVFSVCVLAAASLLIYADLSGHVMVDNWRLARAISRHGESPTAGTEHELDDATAAAARQRTIVLVFEALLFAAALGGVVVTTRSIRKNDLTRRVARIV
jgi:hypothetical protein